jgi:hypothetical protein
VDRISEKKQLTSLNAAHDGFWNIPKYHSLTVYIKNESNLHDGPSMHRCGDFRTA